MMLVKYWILNIVDIGDGVTGLEDVQSGDFHTPGLNVLVGHSLPSSAYFQKRSTDFPLRFPEPIYPEQVEVSCDRAQLTSHLRHNAYVCWYSLVG